MAVLRLIYSIFVTGLILLAFFAVYKCIAGAIVDVRESAWFLVFVGSLATSFALTITDTEVLPAEWVLFEPQEPDTLIEYLFYIPRIILALGIWIITNTFNFAFVLMLYSGVSCGLAAYSLWYKPMELSSFCWWSFLGGLCLYLLSHVGTAIGLRNSQFFKGDIRI